MNAGNRSPKMPASEISRLGIAKQHYQYGLEFLEQRDWNASIRKFREVIGLVPDKADAHFHMGNALRSAGDLDRTVAEFRVS